MTRYRRRSEAGDPPLPPVPDGAVMVTLKIARFNPEDPDARRLAELPGAVPAHATGCSTCCTTSSGTSTAR